jgi:hypothetical protein
MSTRKWLYQAGKRDHYEERAIIIEFDGLMDRDIAENNARKDTIKHYAPKNM